MTRHFISHLNQPLNLNFPEVSITLLSLSLLLTVVRGNSRRQPQVISAPNFWLWLGGTVGDISKCSLCQTSDCGQGEHWETSPSDLCAKLQLLSQSRVYRYIMCLFQQCGASWQSIINISTHRPTSKQKIHIEKSWHYFWRFFIICLLFFIYSDLCHKRLCYEQMVINQVTRLSWQCCQNPLTMFTFPHPIYWYLSQLPNFYFLKWFLNFVIDNFTS